MAVEDYSETPASNVTINGINIGEGMAPSSVNNALRQLMADIAVYINGVPDSDTLMPISAGVFSGTQPIYSGRGAYLHHNDSGNVSGRIYVLAEGTANPASPSNGDIVLFFTP